jgi:hypothetical protein
MHTIYGKRLHKYGSITDSKTNEVLDDGAPKKIRLGAWADKKIAEAMASNLKKSVKKNTWKIWVE